MTNPAIFAEGIEAGIANAILIKLNQIGTITETLETIGDGAQGGLYGTVDQPPLGRDRGHDHRRLRRGHGAGQIKTGSLCRTERVAKYNQLLRIEKELGARAIFPGKRAFPQAKVSMLKQPRDGNRR